MKKAHKAQTEHPFKEVSTHGGGRRKEHFLWQGESRFNNLDKRMEGGVLENPSLT